MTYAVFLHTKAAKELKKLEPKISAGITQAAKELRENPDKIGKPLSHSDFWSLRAGDYRAIYEVGQREKRVVILFVGHRSKVYDDFTNML